MGARSTRLQTWEQRLAAARAHAERQDELRRLLPPVDAADTAELDELRAAERAAWEAWQDAVAMMHAASNELRLAKLRRVGCEQAIDDKRRKQAGLPPRKRAGA